MFWCTVLVCDCMSELADCVFVDPWLMYYDRIKIWWLVHRRRLWIYHQHLIPKHQLPLPMLLLLLRIMMMTLTMKILVWEKRVAVIRATNVGAFSFFAFVLLLLRRNTYFLRWFYVWEGFVFAISWLHAELEPDSVIFAVCHLMTKTDSTICRMCQVFFRNFWHPDCGTDHFENLIAWFLICSKSSSKFIYNLLSNAVVDRQKPKA